MPSTPRACSIGYVVANMDRALKTWQDQGATLVVPPAVDPAQNVVCCLLVYGRAVPIELVAPLREGPNPIEARLRKGGGLDHICLFSDDLEKDLAGLRDSGGLVVVEPCYGAVFDRNLAFIATRIGLIVELMTRTAVGRLPNDPLEYLSAVGDGTQKP
jgi:methylmalonyl-CoA/ethylmalonyl-CoA epimerase